MPSETKVEVVVTGVSLRKWICMVGKTVVVFWLCTSLADMVRFGTGSGKLEEENATGVRNSSSEMVQIHLGALDNP